jgi:uncharacterized protein (TIGR03083 family)
MARPQPDAVLALYTEGMDAFVEMAGRLGEEHWRQPVTDQWTATDLAGHVLVVARWYHEWLDRAEEGVRGRPFAYDELASRNASALAALPSATGPERVAEFAAAATAYAERLPATWDLRYGFPYGTVTAGVHAGAAASEWHVHCWDLGRAAGATHRPSDPALLYECLGTALTAARTGLLPDRLRLALSRWTVQRAVARTADPWAALLDRSGRQPA